MCGAAAIIAACDNGIRYYGFGVLFNPLLEEFRWTRAQTSFAFTAAMVEGGLEAPLAGWAIDKWGPRVVIWFGITLVSLGYILLGQVNSRWQFYVVYILVISFGGGAAAYAPGWKAMSDWFAKRRSTAMGAIGAGGAFGGVVSNGLAWAIIRYGWRRAAMMGGVVMMVVCLPLGLIMRPHPPEYYGMYRDGLSPVEGKEPAERGTKGAADWHVARDFTLRQALRTSGFWLVVFVAIVNGAATGAMTVHLDPLLMDMGVSAQVAAMGLAWLAIWKIPGRLVVSYFADKIGAKNAIIIALGFALSGLLIMVRAETPSLVLVSMAIYGLGAGPLVILPAALIAEYFGRKHYAKIQGWRTGLSVVGTAFGAPFSGLVYDITKSYTLSFIVYCVALAAGIAAILFARRPGGAEERTPV